MMPRHTSLALAACLLQTAAAAPGASQSLPGYRYEIRMSTESGDRLTAHVRDVGDRARIDFDRPGDAGGSYLLLLEGGHRVLAVHPREREYSVVDDTTLERIVGTALHAVSATGLVRFRLDNVAIVPERLEAGDTVAGRATRRYRLTQEYTVGVRALGLGGDDIHQTVVTDYWVDPSLRLLRNPLLELLATLETALAQQDTAFVRMSATARRALFTGVPLKVVVKHASGDGDAGVRTLAVADLQRDAFGTATFQVPAGYRRRATPDFTLHL
jgi:hypothetical protein